MLKLDVMHVAVAPSTEYDLAGVYSFGRGLFRRSPMLGAKTSYSYLNSLRAGQFVMSKLKAWEGAVAVVDPNFEGCVLSPEFPTYTVDEQVMVLKFLRLLTRYPPLWALLAQQSRGVGGRKERVHQRAVLDVPILLPPLDEQRRIVDLIAAVDEAIEAAERQVQTTNGCLSALSRDLLDQTSDHERLGEIAEVTIGRQRSPENAKGDHMVQYLRAANVKDGRLELGDVLAMNFTPSEQETFALRRGDVLVSEGCGSLEQLGASASWHSDLEGPVCFQNTLLRLRSLNGVTTPEYLHHLARHAFRSGWWANIASGTNIFHIGLRRAKELSVPVPSLEQQDRMTELLGSLDSLMCQTSLDLEILVSLRAALLDDLLSGEHEIPASYDELLRA